MELPIAPLGQRDTRWASKKLGNSSVLTIGSDGCLLVCHSMMLGYYGHESTPDVLNEIYKSKGVFDNAMINFYAAGNVYGDVNAVEYYNCETTPCDLTKIDNQLAKKQPVICYVDNVNHDNKPDHFALIIGKTDDGHYLVNDPWMGERYYFDAKWGDPSAKIYGLRIYEGVPKEQINYEDKIRELTDKLASCNQALSEKSAEVANLTKDLADQERDNVDLAKQLTEARSKRDTALWEKDQLDAKVKLLEGQILAKDAEITRLQSERMLDKYSTLELTREILTRVFQRR